MMNKPIPALCDLLDWSRRQAYKPVAAIQLDKCASRGMLLAAQAQDGGLTLGEGLGWAGSSRKSSWRERHLN